MTTSILGLGDLHIGVQYLLASAAAVYMVARAYAHIITSRAARDRSRRDADLAGAKHLDERISGLFRDAARVGSWEAHGNYSEGRHPR